MTNIANAKTIPNYGECLDGPEIKTAARAAAQGLRLLKNPEFGELAHTIEGFALMRVTGFVLMSGIPSIDDVERVLDEVRPYHRQYAREYLWSRIDGAVSLKEVQEEVGELLMTLEGGRGRDAELIARAMRLELAMPEPTWSSWIYCDLTETFWKNFRYGDAKPVVIDRRTAKNLKKQRTLEIV